MAKNLIAVLHTTTIIAGLGLIATAVHAGPNSPNMPNISPPNISAPRPELNIRAPNVLREHDTTGNDSSRATIKKTINNGKTLHKNAQKKKKLKQKGIDAASGHSNPAVSTPTVSGTTLGLTPAGKTLENLQGKIDVPALDAVQGAAALPGVFGTPGGDTGGLPGVKRDPSVGRIMTLPSVADRVGNDADDARATVRVLSFVEGHYHPQQSESTTGRTSPNGDIERVTTWDMGGGRKIEMRELIIDGVSSYVVTDTRSGRWVEASTFDERGTLRGNTVRYADDGESTQVYDQHGRHESSASYDSRGHVTSMSLGHANPTSGGSGNKDSASGSAPVTKPTGATDSSGNTTSSNSGGSGNTVSSSGNTVSGSGNKTSDSSGNTTSGRSGNTISRDSSGNNIGPSKDSSQPAEGAGSKRNFFGEAGITHPGGRPKEERRGPLVSGVAEPSGVIIRRDGPRTPDELKAAVTQPGLGDAQSSGGGGSNSGPAVSRFAQPPQGTTPGINSSNTNLTGSGVPEAGSGLIKPKPAEQR